MKRLPYYIVQVVAVLSFVPAYGQNADRITDQNVGSIPPAGASVDNMPATGSGSDSTPDNSSAVPPTDQKAQQDQQTAKSCSTNNGLAADGDAITGFYTDGGNGSLNQLIKAFNEAYSATNSPLYQATATELSNSAKTFVEDQPKCVSRYTETNHFCLENCSPTIAAAIPVIQGAMAVAQMGIANSCSKFAKVMNYANDALLAYQVQCTAWKGFCQSACSGAVNSLGTIQGDIKDKVIQGVVTKLNGLHDKNQQAGIPDPQPLSDALGIFNGQAATNANTFIKNELNSKQNSSSLAKMNSTCGNYAIQVASAAMGAVNVIKSMQAAQNCDTATTALATPTPVDCTIAANQTTVQQCICEIHPYIAGCPQNLAGAGGSTSGSSSLTPSSLSPSTGGSAGAAPIGGPGGPLINGGPGDTNTGGAGAMGGGGNPVGMDGGVTPNGGAGAGAGKPTSRVNTNILAGEGGGGSGGGGGSAGPGTKDALRQYLPGGKRDPAAQVAGTQAIGKEVTSEGGKSNWEKVTDRYRDNKPSLLGY